MGFLLGVAEVFLAFQSQIAEEIYHHGIIVLNISSWIVGRM